jgi:hypothetical protein
MFSCSHSQFFRKRMRRVSTSFFLIPQTKFDTAEILKEGIKLKISQIGKNEIDFNKRNKHQLDRYFTELEKIEMVRYEHLI